MKVLLIILNNRTNGVKTFTYHLYKSLASLGVDVEILKLHSRDEGISRKYVQDVYYRNTSIESLIAKAKTNPSITTTPAAEHKLEMQWLAEAGSKMMVHADFELDWNLPLGDKPIVVRKKLQRLVPGSIFIPHPYVRQFTKKVKKSKHAVSITRLDKRKGTGDILRAIMYNGADIDLYGDLMPFYGMFLNDNYPGWRKLWKGKFPTLEGANVVAPYKYMLDMTLFENDGGGSQYTILEAMDSGTIPVIRKEWEGGELKHGLNCIVVEDPKEIIGMKRNIAYKSMESVLHRHDYTNVARRFMKCLK